MDYDRWHEQRLRDSGEPPAVGAPWHEMALAQIGRLEGLRVLEIGCGLGAFAEELAQRGADLTAADISRHAVDYTARRLAGYENATVQVASIQELPFADHAFDLVVSLETLEHVPEPDTALADLVRVTALDGRLIISGPNYLNLVGLYRIYLRLLGRRYTELDQPINHPLLFPLQVWKLRRLGCRILHTEGRQHWLPLRRSPRFERLPGAKWVAYDTLVVARRGS